MTLYIIGIGLWDKEDITIKGLEAVKRSEKIYLENYTSKLGCSVEDLEKFYGKKIILADRDLIESKTEDIVKEAKEKPVALLIIGDPFSATTHIEYLLTAKKLNTPVEVIHNASILNAVGEIGLELYKYGRTVSIPFDYKDLKSPIEAINSNQKNNIHTLILLDLDPKNNRFLKIKDVAKYLIDNGFDESLIAVGIAGLGSKKPEIKTATLAELSKKDFKLTPQSLIIPAKTLHFKEEEALNLWRE